MKNENENVGESVAMMNDMMYIFCKKRVIYIDGEITDETATSVIGQLMYHNSYSNKPIKIYINSFGGDCMAAFAIYDAIQSSPSVVETYNVGCAMSAAAVILCSGDKGHRYALPHSTTMIHQVSSETGGTVSNMSIQVAEVERVNSVIKEIMSKHTKLSVDKITKLITVDRFMTADDAKKYGLVDFVVEPLDRSKIVSSFDGRKKKGK